MLQFINSSMLIAYILFFKDSNEIDLNRKKKQQQLNLESHILESTWEDRFRWHRSICIWNCWKLWYRFWLVLLFVEINLCTCFRLLVEPSSSSSSSSSSTATTSSSYHNNTTSTTSATTSTSIGLFWICCLLAQKHLILSRFKRTFRRSEYRRRWWRY